MGKQQVGGLNDDPAGLNSLRYHHYIARSVPRKRIPFVIPCRFRSVALAFTNPWSHALTEANRFVLFNPGTLFYQHSRLEKRQNYVKPYVFFLAVTTPFQGYANATRLPYLRHPQTFVGPFETGRIEWFE